MAKIDGAVTFDSEGVRSKTRYLGYSKFLRDYIFEVFSTIRAKTFGRKTGKGKTNTIFYGKRSVRPT